MAPTPGTANFIFRMNYTVASKVHRLDFWIPQLTLPAPPTSALAVLSLGSNAGTQLSAIEGTINNAVKAVLHTTDEITSYTLLSVQWSPVFVLTPLFTDTLHTAGTQTGAATLGSSARFVMKAGTAKGAIVLNETFDGSVPSRTAAPTPGGTSVFDKLWNAHTTAQYFSLKDSVFPTAVFAVSHQYNKKLLKLRGLR